jgi:group I intron endonuclease
MLMFVYVMRNTKNNKVYVGQDSGSAAEMRRVKNHCNDAKKFADGRLKNASKIAAAIAKYGIEAFEITIDSWGYKSKDDLNQAEIELISKFGSIRNGYNILPGGQGMPSNSSISDPVLLERLRCIRSRGAKTSNANRWSKATDEDRQKVWEAMKIGREGPHWRENIKASWDRLDADARAERSRQMKEGRPTRFVLMDRDGKEVRVETNLRTLLSGLVTDIPKKQIERIVRNDNLYCTEEFSIEKRHR